MIQKRGRTTQRRDKGQLDEDYLLIKTIQSTVGYLQKLLIQDIYKFTGQRIRKHKRGHKFLLIEQIWRDDIPPVVEQYWKDGLKRKETISLGSLVGYFSSSKKNYKLSQQWEKCMAAIQRLMEKHKGLAMKLAYLFGRKIYHLSTEDLIGEALLGLFLAALRFNFSYKIRFTTYAYRVVWSYLKDSVSRNQVGLSYSAGMWQQAKRAQMAPQIIYFSSIPPPDIDESIYGDDEDADDYLSMQGLSGENSLCSSAQDENSEEEVYLRDEIAHLPPIFREFLLNFVDSQSSSIKQFAEEYGLPWRIPQFILEQAYNLLMELRQSSSGG